ncbi:MAG: NUDIX hydrolase [Candidatus Aminicenantes bacterium]|nr:NUDIX hydrolase [Candidatus Aminicenantes bacterium]
MKRRSAEYCQQCGSKLGSTPIEGIYRRSCGVCGWVSYENPLPSSAAFVKNSSDEILLVKRGVDPGKGQWALPSGFIEIDETPAKACLRELKEETGLDGVIEKLLGVYSQESLMYKNVIIIAYFVQAQGRLIPGSDSVSAAYFSLKRLPVIAFSSHREIITDGVNS